MSAEPSKASDPGELQKLLWSLRPTLRDLFRGYDVPEEEASTFVRETVEILAIECHRRPVREPRRWLLDTLEERCRAYREALESEQEAEEDGGTDRGSPYT